MASEWSTIAEIFKKLADNKDGIFFTYEILKYLSKKATMLSVNRYDKFLKYDLKFLIKDCYSYEEAIDSYIPYTQIVDLTEHRVRDELVDSSFTIKVINDFEISKGVADWFDIRESGFAEIKKDKRVTHSSNVIRLAEEPKVGDKIELVLQRASYYDQCRSNLILDWSSNVNNGISLRQILNSEYENKYPKFSDNRIANTIGISSLIYYKQDGVWVPYTLRRSKDVAVFPGALQCTSAAAAAWPTDPILTFSNFFIDDMYKELKDEAGLSKDDIQCFRPVSICREMLRGGKPQIFFCGITALSRNELLERRRNAARVIKQMNDKDEIEKNKFFRTIDVRITTKNTSDVIKKCGIGFETIAALYYGDKYLKLYFGTK